VSLISKNKKGEIENVVRDRNGKVVYIYDDAGGESVYDDDREAIGLDPRFGGDVDILLDADTDLNRGQKNAIKKYYGEVPPVMVYNHTEQKIRFSFNNEILYLPDDEREMKLKTLKKAFDYKLMNEIFEMGGDKLEKMDKRDLKEERYGLNKTNIEEVLRDLKDEAEPLNLDDPVDKKIFKLKCGEKVSL